MGRVRFLRAGLVTSLPGGPGIDPAGITTAREVHRSIAVHGEGNAFALWLA